VAPSPISRQVEASRTVDTESSLLLVDTAAQEQPKISFPSAEFAWFANSAARRASRRLPLPARQLIDTLSPHFSTQFTTLYQAAIPMARVPFAAGSVLFIACCGCALNATPAPLPLAMAVSENPALLPVADREFFWDTLVDVVDDYFTIDREQRVHQVGNELTEGRIDTFPEIGSTYLEPWRRDSVNSYEKLESTLQSIRRQALVRVMPSAEGYVVEVAVFKELEDLARPDYATSGGATFRYDNSLDRTELPVGERSTTQGWIPQGRDIALEQQILCQLKARVGVAVAPAGNYQRY